MGVQASVLGVRTGAAAQVAFFTQVSQDRRIPGACPVIGFPAVVPGGWRCPHCDPQSG